MGLQEIRDAIRASNGVPTAASAAKVREGFESGVFPSLSQLTETRSSPTYGEFDFEPYQYSALPSPTSIRLLQVHGKDSDGLTRCSLVTVDLNDCPLYLCLSYTWGNPHAKGTIFTWSEETVAQYSSETTWPISCNDKLLYITQNLYDALDQMPPHPWTHMRDNRDHKTVLHRAAAGGKSIMAWSAVAHGAILNSKDKYGKTPLHYAAENGHLEIAEMLVSAGADLNLLDHTQRTPTAYAQQNGNHEVLQYLTKLEKQSEGVEVTLGLREDMAATFLWIDAICIDQGNPVERGHQVSFMDRIYKEATCVSIWLGSADVLTEVAFKTFSELAIFHQQLGDSDIRPYEENPSDVYQKAGLPFISSLQWNALAALYLRQWFTRAWVLQEVVLAQDLMVFCGRFALLFNDLAVVTEALCRRYKAIGYPTSSRYGFTKINDPKRPHFAPFHSYHSVSTLQQ